MAGTVTTPTESTVRGWANVYTVTWTSDGAGIVSGNSFMLPSGGLLQVEIIPDTGATQPDAGFDLALNDANGSDLLQEQGQDLSNVGTTTIGFTTPLYIRKQLVTPVVAGAGAANAGKLVLTIR